MTELEKLLWKMENRRMSGTSLIVECDALEKEKALLIAALRYLIQEVRKSGEEVWEPEMEHVGLILRGKKP